MTAGISLQLLAALECAVCGQLIGMQRRINDETEVGLFGARPYAQCPCCRQIVGPEFDTIEYRQAADARIGNFERREVTSFDAWAVNAPCSLFSTGEKR